MVTNNVSKVCFMVRLIIRSNILIIPFITNTSEFSDSNDSSVVLVLTIEMA